MIYQDWDLELTGQHISITPLTEKDDEAYGRVLMGDLYDSFLELGQKPSTGLKTILDRTAKDETHAIRPLGSDLFWGWISLQKNSEGAPDVGISLVADQQNKGYGPEAVQLFGNYLHGKYGLEQLSVRTSAKNIQCQNAFSKVGAVFDKEVVDQRYASLMESHPDLASYGEMIKTRYYHVPLPILEIQPESGIRMDEEARKKAQAAYIEEERQLMKKYQLAELEDIRKKIDGMGDAPLTEVKDMIKQHIEELENRQ